MRIAEGVPEIQRFQPADENTPEEDLISRPRSGLLSENCNNHLNMTKTFAKIVKVNFNLGKD